VGRNHEQFDVVVVGGGPGGSTAATFIAMQGHRVLLLEKEAFPIHKIGESLLPATIHGICNMLGVKEELEAANFIRKYGGTYRWGKSKEPWTFSFSQSAKLPGPTSYAYQVERMKFDSLLLANARRKGVEVREKHSALNPVVEGDRISGLEFQDHEGQHREVRCRYLVDASGYTSCLARHVGERIYSQFFRNVALFGYYRNAKRLQPPRSGNIFCAAFDKGWFWFIPLSDTLTSVGAVIGQEHAQILRRGLDTALSDLIASCDPIADLLSGSSRVTEGPYGEVRVRKDYSYCQTKFWRPGLVLIGDAACFVDPVFSSGVHLATYSALLCARSVNSCMGALMSENRAFGEFENRYRREFTLFYDFLTAFYDVDQELEDYYWAARKATNSPDLNNEAFIQLVAGVGGSQEKLYASAEEFKQARERLGKNLFPGAYGAAPEVALTNSESGSDNRKFMSELLSEVVQVQLQAMGKDRSLHERPLFKGGLVPSVDGFHWAEFRTHPMSGSLREPIDARP
jgi:FAD-dependent halogenase